MLLKDKIDKKAAWERRRMDAEKRKGCLHVHHDHRCEKCVVYLEKEKAKWEVYDKPRFYDIIKKTGNNWIAYQLDSNKARARCLGEFDHYQQALEQTKAYDCLRCQIDYPERALGYTA